LVDSCKKRGIFLKLQNLIDTPERMNGSLWEEAFNKSIERNPKDNTLFIGVLKYLYLILGIVI